jgi:uncharacterized RDD family membrane protein YckC
MNVATVSIGKRFIHFVIDYLFVSFLLLPLLGALIGIVSALTGVDRSSMNKILSYRLLLGAGTMILYYILFEYFLNKTIGKFLTRSIVVTETDTKPSFKSCLLRTLIRFVPFEAFSILSSDSKMWHDKWTKTVVTSSATLKNNDIDAIIDPNKE